MKRWSPCRQVGGKASSSTSASSSGEQRFRRHREQVGRRRAGRCATTSRRCASSIRRPGCAGRRTRRRPRRRTGCRGGGCAPRALELLAELAVGAVERPAGESHSPSTSAWRMNSSRAYGWSMRANWTRRRRHDRHAVEGDPLVGDDGALLLLPVRLGVRALARGRRRAAPPRPGRSRRSCGRTADWSRPVRRSSRASGCFFARAEPGKITNRACGRRCSRGAALLAGCVCSSRRPMWLSRPASSARWMPSGLTLGSPRSCSPSCFASRLQLPVDVLPLAHAQEVEVLAPCSRRRKALAESSCCFSLR